MDLKQLAALDEVANRHRLNAEQLGLAAAASPVPIALELDQLGQPSDQSGDYLSLIIGQPLVRDGNGVRRFTIDMGQRQAIGIDDTIATGNRLKPPWSRKPATSHDNALC
jgi:hypothetical protein